VQAVAAAELPAANEGTMTLGRNLEGCRIGFDLGGSDRKCAAVIDGKVVFSEEVVWDPYFQNDSNYHIEASTTRSSARPPICRGWTRSAAVPPGFTSTTRSVRPRCSAA